jgi:hypothetical protein
VEPELEPPVTLPGERPNGLQQSRWAYEFDPLEARRERGLPATHREAEEATWLGQAPAAGPGRQRTGEPGTGLWRNGIKMVRGGTLGDLKELTSFRLNDTNFRAWKNTILAEFAHCGIGGANTFF